MSSNSKEAPLSDNVSKQLTYDDDGNEDAGRRVKVNKEKKTKNAKKMFEHNDETAAGRSMVSKKVSKGSSSTTPTDKAKNIDSSSTTTYKRSESTETAQDSAVKTKLMEAMLADA
jgi:hypothetical protein